MIAERLSEKLGISKGNHICLVDAPQDFAPMFEKHLLGKARLTDYIGLRGFDLVMWWPFTITGLEVKLARLAYSIKPDGAVWLVIPKRQFADQRGINFSWAEMQAIALQTDMVDNKTVSISSTDYATRFVIRTQHRYKYL